MSAKGNAKFVPAPSPKAAVEKPAESSQSQSNESASTPKRTYSYFRVRKINGFLSECLQVEIDESVTPPKVVGKQDDRGIVLDRLRDRLNDEACTNFETDRKAKK